MTQPKNDKNKVVASWPGKQSPSPSPAPKSIPQDDRNKQTFNVKLIESLQNGFLIYLISC